MTCTSMTYMTYMTYNYIHCRPASLLNPVSSRVIVVLHHMFPLNPPLATLCTDTASSSPPSAVSAPAVPLPVRHSLGAIRVQRRRQTLALGFVRTSDLFLPLVYPHMHTACGMLSIQLSQ